MDTPTFVQMLYATSRLTESQDFFKSIYNVLPHCFPKFSKAFDDVDNPDSRQSKCKL